MRKLVWTLAACLSLAVATTAWAGDGARPKSSGFFSFLHSLFSSDDESAERDRAPARAASGSAQMNGQAGQSIKKGSFIYLDDGTGPAVEDRVGATFRLRATAPKLEAREVVTPSLLLELGRGGAAAGNGFVNVAPLNTHDMRHSGSRVGMSVVTPDPKNLLSEIDISLTSRVLRQASDLPGYPAGVNIKDPNQRQAYSLGLNVGYAGFYAGANYGRQQESMLLGYRGYDIAFGYQGRRWSTGVQLSDYRKDSDLLGVVGPDGIREVQLGAAYSVWPWMTFSGQFRYYDYNNRGSRDLLLDQSRVFTLGTSLNF